MVKNKRLIVAILAIILAALMIVPILMSLFDPAAATSKINDLKDKASSLAQEKKEIQAELNQIQRDKASAIQHKVALDKQIEITIQEIDNSNEILAATQEQIEVKKAEVASAVEDEREAYQLFRSRVRVMEEAGSTSYVAILMSASSFSDLLGRSEVISDIMEYDRKLMNNLEVARVALSEAQTALEGDLAAEQAVLETLSARKTELEANKQQANELIAELMLEEEEHKKAILEAEEAEQKLQEEIAAKLAELARQNTRVYVGGDFGWPLPAANRNVTSEYGMRLHPVLNVMKLHTGVDIGAKYGTPIYAANAGTVIKAGYNSGYGNYVVIDHGGGRATLYAHMSRILASENQTVGKGDKIGEVGSTGYSTGPHLHFEIILDGKQVDPMGYYQLV